MSTPEEVREQIIDAFDDAPMPAVEDFLLPGFDTLGADVRDALAGRHWRTLTSTGIAPWRFHFMYFSAAAFRHYLPSVLLAGLDDYGRPLGRMQALKVVTPSECSAYYQYQGRNALFEHQISLLTQQQREAVTSFLALFLVDQDLADYPSYELFAAARAFRLGWSQFETTARPRFQAFDHRMRNFTHTPPNDPNARAVFDRIFEAFANTPYPGDYALAQEVGDDEVAESALDFGGVKWQNAHPHLISVHYNALSFLSAAGLRYFLPAFLVSDLCGYESNAEPLFALTHGFAPARESPVLSDDILERAAEMLPPELKTVGDLRELMRKNRELMRKHQEVTSKTDWFAHGVQRFADYSRQERKAIIKYLGFRAKDDEYEAPTIEAALERYWRPSLTGSV